MVFKVPSEDLLIKRCINHLKIKTGDTIVVQFTGGIDVGAGNVIQGAITLSEATIADGDVWIAE